MIPKTLKTQVRTGIKTVLNSIRLNASTSEKRLMIDMKLASEAYNEGIIDEVILIRIKFNLADTMKKWGFSLSS